MRTLAAEHLEVAINAVHDFDVGQRRHLHQLAYARSIKARRAQCDALEAQSRVRDQRLDPCDGERPKDFQSAERRTEGVGESDERVIVDGAGRVVLRLLMPDLE